MAVESVNYQCPACGGPLHFSESKGLMVCDYCESSFEVAQIEAHYAAKQSKADASAVAAAERAASGEMSAFEAMGATDGRCGGLDRGCVECRCRDKRPRKRGR